MARRPLFIPNKSGSIFVSNLAIEFIWHPGLSVIQKQKSISSLHESAKKTIGIKNILEISSKSGVELGVRLSAFNLSLRTSSGLIASVESLFQGSKVFSKGGPFQDIYHKTPREAKKDERLKDSGNLLGFLYDNRKWPINPQTVFYDWLYLSALYINTELSEKMLKYDGFTDIEFNPQKSINCQAASAALYKSLFERNLIGLALSSPDEFIRIQEEQKQRSVPIQPGLF